MVEIFCIASAVNASPDTCLGRNELLEAVHIVAIVRVPSLGLGLELRHQTVDLDASKPAPITKNGSFENVEFKRICFRNGYRTTHRITRERWRRNRKWTKGRKQSG